jgi:hypothetical protein
MENIPEGYRKNATGHLVPIDQIREQDALRDEVVCKLAASAEELSASLASFKRQALGDIADLVQIAADKYGAHLGGEKGNVSLMSFDGRWKVTRSVTERILFTEELEAAKALVNNCIICWSNGANPNIRVLVDRAFRTDSKGQIKTAAVLELLRLEINDDEWKNAMQAIRDSIQTAGTSVYVRVYRRVGDSDQYEQVLLDLSSV